MKQFIIGLALTLTFVAGAEAATYYVATNGSDSTSCSQAQNASTPKRNISTASGGISCLSSGDTLRIRGGTYDENIANWPDGPVAAFPPSGSSWSNATTIEGYPGETITLRPSSRRNNLISLATGGNTHYVVFRSLVLDASLISRDVLDVSCVYAGQDFIRYDSVECKNLYASTGVNVNASNVEFLNCKIHDTQTGGPSVGASYGFYIMSASSNVLVERCQIYNHGGYGIHDWSDKTQTNNIFRFNEIYNTGQTSQSFTSAAVIVSHGTGHRVYGNLIRNNSTGIIVDSSCVNCLIYNNTVYSNKVGIQIYPGAVSSTVKNNIVHQNPTGDILNSGAGTTMSNNLTVDPKFTNPGANDFRLQPGSPAIDAGADLSAFGALVDMNGAARPQGCCYDIGAYEYGTTTSTMTPAVAPVFTVSVSADSSYPGYSSASVNDGVINAAGGQSSTWASDASPVDHWLHLAFPSPLQLNTATIFWAFNNYQQRYMTAGKVELQYWTGTSYQTISSFLYPGSNVASSTISFPTITTSQLRFFMPAGQGNSAYSDIFWLTEVTYGLEALAPTAPSNLLVLVP